VSLALSVLGTGAEASSARSRIPHLDLDATSTELEQRLAGRPVPRTAPRLGVAEPGKKGDSDFQPIYDLGKRNLDWVSYINQFRDRANKVSLSWDPTRAASPMDAQRIYNPTIINKMYEDVKAALPKSLKAVLRGTGDFPKTPPMSDEDFI